MLFGVGYCLFVLGLTRASYRINERLHTFFFPFTHRSGADTVKQNSTMMNRTIEKSVNAGLGYPFMKKILLLVAAVGCGVFFGCEKDVSSKDSKLDYSDKGYVRR